MSTFTKFIGACCRYGQKKEGVQLGPKTIFQNMGNSFDVKFIENFENNGYQNLFKTHHRYLSGGWKPITVGGDHSISLATVASSAKQFKEALTVVWVDAHADINTYESSNSKNLHGMPLACLLGHDNMYNLPEIKPEQIIYIGLRDVDEYENKVITDLNIEHYTMKDLETQSLTDILDNIMVKSEAIHLSFDVDALDPEIISCTGTTVPNGLSMNQGKEIINKLSPKIISADVVEFNPLLGNKQTAIRDTFRIISLLELLD